MNTDELSVAVIHGNYFTQGGGERVAEALAKAFDAPLYYGFGDEEAIPDNGTEHIRLFNCRPLTNRIASRVYQFRDACFMWWGQHLPELSDYDVIVTSGNEFGWYVPTDDQVVVKYVHSPPRGAYDLFHTEGEHPLFRLYQSLVRPLYRPTTSYPDVYVSNSELVQRRVSKYWGLPSEVVYPPIETAAYDRMLAPTEPDLFVTINRLYDHKRTDEIVDAFSHMPERRLVVCGDGPEREHLEAIAPPNVDIRGYVSESEKAELLSRAGAFIQNARNEDFGIVTIEAYASGTPVIGVEDGFTQYQIVDGVNGMLYSNEGRVPAIHDAVQRFDSKGVKMGEVAIERFAENFSFEQFSREMHAVVERAIEKASIDPIVPAIGDHAVSKQPGIADGGTQ